MAIEISLYNKYNKSKEFNTLLAIATSSITEISKLEKTEFLSLAIILVNDKALKKMHKDFLNDDTYTDVMTFNTGDASIEAELYISIDRAKDHSQIYNVSLSNEISRLIIHGLLHLAGYDDHSDIDRKQMREKENFYLNRLNI